MKQIDLFSFKNIQLGKILKDKNTKFPTNNIIILIEYYIHKCRFTDFYVLYMCDFVVFVFWYNKVVSFFWLFFFSSNYKHNHESHHFYI